jgi:enamine deaminase RidA (YjgF/YER057c/UK114 family)
VEVNRQIHPRTIAEPAANYAHAVITEGPTRWLHSSGVVPTAPNGSVASGIAEQAEQVWVSIAAILGAANMRAADIVSITTYVVAGEPLGPVMAARDAFMGWHKAASTLVTVPALARPDWKVEISIVAAAP